MRKPLVNSLLALAAMATLPEASDAAPATATVAPATTEGQRLMAIVAASDEAALRLTPQNGLWRGDARFANQFGDLISDDWLAQMQRAAESDMAAIRSIDRTRLSEGEGLVYDTLLFSTELNLRYYRSGLGAIQARMPIDQFTGHHLLYPQTASGESGIPHESVKDFEDELGRMAGFVLFLERCIPRMREGMSRGQVHHRVVVEKMIEQIDDILKPGIEGSAFWKPILAMPSTIPAAEQDRLRNAFRESLSGSVFPAYRRLRTFFNDEYLPAARTGAPGISAIPDGDRLYQWNLESFTTTAMTAAEIHLLGVSEVARIENEMEQIKREVGFQGTLPEFFRHLNTSPQFKFANEENMLRQYSSVQQRVASLLPRWFANLPKSALEIRPVPLEQRSSAGGAYYQIGTPDGARPGAFYVNTGDLPARLTTRTTALFLHEGAPGHHVQGSLAQENAALPAFLRFGYFLGFGEGWGLYSERLGYEMGLYEDPYQRMGALDLEMFRAIRLVVDTGIHAQGWSREQAITYFLEHSSLDRASVESEIDRYIVWPGQATAYKVGQIFILKLRSKAERALGRHFDIRAFHDQVLNSGALPLTVLEAKIDGWIARERGQK